MKYQFMVEQSGEFPVDRMCRVLGVSRSGYYAWRRRQPSLRDQANEVLLKAIQQVHQASRQTYGSPRIHASLKRQAVTCSRKRVARLMRLHGMRGAAPRRRRPRTTQRQAGALPAPNLLDQAFTAAAPNEKWVADITYIDTLEGWLYLATILDLFHRAVVGWAMEEHLETELIERALDMALGRRSPHNLLHHSDQGCQYTSLAYQARLRDIPAQVSMSRVGNCYDNAAMESFIGTLKTECANRRFATRAEARCVIFEFIEVWYNRQRLHSTLGYLSPLEFEQRYLSDIACVH
jgi:putative transposase